MSFVECFAFLFGWLVRVGFTNLSLIFLDLNINRNFYVCSLDVLASQEQQMNEIVTIDQREYSCT